MSALEVDVRVLGCVDHCRVVNLREGVALELKLTEERAPDGLDLQASMRREAT